MFRVFERIATNCLIAPLDLKELALKIATDPDHKFDLALQLDDLDTALEIVRAESEVKGMCSRLISIIVLIPYE